MTQADCTAAQDADAEPTLGDSAGAKPPNRAKATQADGAVAHGSASMVKAAAADPLPWEDDPTAAGPCDDN